jgi:hypothetical protein
VTLACHDGGTLTEEQSGRLGDAGFRLAELVLASMNGRVRAASRPTLRRGDEMTIIYRISGKRANIPATAGPIMTVHAAPILVVAAPTFFAVALSV